MRLNAYLARAGISSRRKADELIKAGRVTVNGQAGQLNTFVEPADRVEVDGNRVAPQQLAYVLLNKPAGVVTTANDPRGRLTVVDLVRHDSRVVPVERLDADTTGVLLLTNDGDLAHRLAHPKYEVEKVYEAEVEGEPGETRSAGSPRAWSSKTGRPHRQGATPGPVARRARDPRRTQPAGAADARGGRPSGPPAAPEPLRGADHRRPPGGRVAWLTPDEVTALRSGR